MASNGAGGSNFSKAFLPGLIIGFIVGGVAGAFLTGLGGPGNVKAITGGDQVAPPSGRQFDERDQGGQQQTPEGEQAPAEQPGTAPTDGTTPPAEEPKQAEQPATQPSNPENSPTTPPAEPKSDAPAQPASGGGSSGNTGGGAGEKPVEPK
jgi:hypothetical protein